MASRLRSPAAVPVLVHHTPTSGSGLGSEMNATTRGDQHASTSASTSSSQVPHHERRISNPALASSMPVSYAYGAPPAPVGSSPHGSPVSRSSNRRTNTTGGDANDGQSTSSNSRRRGHRRSQSLLRGEVETGQDESILIEDEDNEEEEDEDSFELEKQRRLEREESIGRSLEPAAVRYARLAERKRNTGSAIRQPTNFRTATTTGASSTSASTSKTRPTTDLNDTSVNIANAFAAAVKGTFSAEGLMRVGGKRATMPAATQETVDHDEDGEEEDSGKETHHAGGGAGTDGSKKRKATGDTTSEEELSEEARAKAKRPKKTTNTSSPERERGNDAAKEQAPGQRKTSPNAKRKSTATDSAYKPAGELEATSEDDVSNDTIARRRKNKGKGRASTGSATSNAIPIGRRDNDVWQKAKKKRGRKSRDAGEGDEEEAAGSDNALGHDDDDDGDMGGMEHDFEPDVSVEPPSVSFFLRDKSPSFDRTQASAQKEMATPQLKLGGYPTSSPGTHSPFQPLRAFTFGFGGRGASAAAPPVHPSIDEFDQTLNAGHAQPSHSFSRSLSLDDSLTRGSSYDYSEEERIVAALEEQRRLNKLAAEQSKGNAGDGVNSLTAGLRRRHRLSGAPALAGIQEEAQHERKSGIGAFLGRLLYRLLAGVWRTIQDPLLDWSKIWRAIGLLLLGLLAMVYLIPKLTSDLPSKSTSSSEHSSIIHYVPFFRPSSTYRAPAAPADSLEELIARLTSLEGAMGQLSSLSDLDRTRTKADHQLLSKMAEQLSSLEQILSNERQNAAKALESSVKANAKQNRELEKTLKGARADLDALVTRVQTFQDAHSGDAADLRKLKASIDAAAKDIASLGGKVAQVAQDVRKGLDGERMAKLALEAIEQRLPAKVAVKVNENGKVEVDATFWQYLRDAFVDKKQVETIVNGKVARELAKLPLKTDGDAPPAPIVIHESPKWDEFLEANDAALRALVSSHIEGRTGSDAIVTRKAFLDTLRREIKTLKADFEAKANENVEKIGQELLRKVAKQDEMKRKESGSGGLASHLHLPFSGHKGSDSGASAGIPSDNMAALVSSLVDSALLRYSKDVLARPDYALFTAGGRVVRTLTSPTYEANPLGASRRALAWVTGTAGPRGRPPVTALHPDNTPGSCWPFVGSTGQLGIQLSRSIVPSDVTIEHVSVDVSLDGTVASAPREFEVWGVVESRSDIERLARYRYEQQETRREAEAQGDEEAKDVELDPPTSIPPTPNHILLAIGSYDAASPTPIQTFPVTPMARQLAIPVQVVILKVLSNHGESAYTCLYRVRVGGMSTTTSAQ